MTITSEDPCRYVTFKLKDELLGIPVEQVQEVLPSRAITPIPLATEEISGFLNLRGQIVTSIDLRRRLNLEPRTPGTKSINIIIKDEEDLISLVVDEVGDVLDLVPSELTSPPATLDAVWREYCRGVFQLERGLLVILDAEKVLDIHVGA